MDEADRLLDPSFAGDLEVIFSSLPPTRQTLLFSATMTRNLSRLKDLALKKPFFWEAPSEYVVVRSAIIPQGCRDVICYWWYRKSGL